MAPLKNLTQQQIDAVVARGCTADDWSGVVVSADFCAEQLQSAHFGGRVELHSGARVVRSAVSNYALGEDVLVQDVSLVECCGRSRFGNGVRVAAVNECGGRSVAIEESLTAQVAYMWAMYRHRERFVAAMESMSQRACEAHESAMGSIGRGSSLVRTRVVRNVRIGEGVQIDGASRLENGTVMNGAMVGADVKATDFIFAEQSHVDGGAVVERCFVGERVRVDKYFSATDSLIFASSHLENGEAVSIFAGPYTVSHHRSSLLIAGYFAFFNAGSGSNQSNHLFKCGAVHQAIHLRGCKFGSNAYVMSPAREGAFTMILGRHSKHHDTAELPYSYLVEQDSRSMLMPGAALASYGTVRDVQKWQQRDKRTLKRDIIDYNEYNPYLGGAMLSALDVLNQLEESSPQSEQYAYKGVHIKQTMLRRGVTLYTKAVVAALGDMLQRGATRAEADGRGRWVDLAGQYAPQSVVEELVAKVERGEVAKVEALQRELQRVDAAYDDYAHSWAEDVLSRLHSRRATEADISEAVASGSSAHAELRQMTDKDCRRDCGEDMAVGYGVDCADKESAMADYRQVRGLEK